MLKASESRPCPDCVLLWAGQLTWEMRGPATFQLLSAILFLSFETGLQSAVSVSLRVETLSFL